MRPLKVIVINWKSSFIAITLGALIHPTFYFCSDMLQNKPLISSLRHSATIFAVYLVIELAMLLRLALSSRLHQIVADDVGLHFKAGRKSKRVGWIQIATFERSMAVEDKVLKACRTLRDPGGQIVGQFFRELQETAATRAQFEALEALIAEKVGKRGLIEGPLDAPVGKSEFVQHSKYGLVGWVTVFLMLPCAFFSWNHPTGGPLIGSIFLLLALLGVVLLLCETKYEVDERGVRSQTRFKTAEMRWDEIRGAAMMRGAMGVRFSGERGALDILGPASWGNDGALLMQFLISQFERYGIAWESNAVLNWHELFTTPKIKL